MVDADFEHPELDQHLDSLSDAEMEKIVRSRLETLYHRKDPGRVSSISISVQRLVLVVWHLRSRKGL